MLWWYTPAINLVINQHINQWVLHQRKEDRRNRLNPELVSNYQHQVFSQNGEDGIIEEIFNRIGTTNRFCIEFGCGNGTENCTRNLIEQGWSGLWIDGDQKLADVAASLTSSSTGLKAIQSLVTSQNICEVFNAHDVPQSPDICVIDIDGNDYWLWEALSKKYSPRVIVIEHNPLFPPSIDWIKPYQADSQWDGTYSHSASLNALVTLGNRLGYSLVGCDPDFVNSFFVRNDSVSTNLRSSLGNTSDHLNAYKQITAPNHIGWPIIKPKPALPTPLSKQQAQLIELNDLEVLYPSKQVIAGQVICLKGKLKNLSQQSIDSSGDTPIRLVSKWLESSEEALRRLILFPIKPGKSCSVGYMCYAPQRPGIYTLRATLVQEGVMWLDEAGSGCYKETVIEVIEKKG